MTTAQIDSHIDNIRTMMRSHLRIRGKTLRAQLRKAGRLLPRAVRREAEFLVQAQDQAQHPKLARMLDMPRIDSAHQVVIDFLETIDPIERRKDRILGILGVLALNILLIGIALVVWMVWTERV